MSWLVSRRCLTLVSADWPGLIDISEEEEMPRRDSVKDPIHIPYTRYYHIMTIRSSSVDVTGVLIEDIIAMRFVSRVTTVSEQRLRVTQTDRA